MGTDDATSEDKGLGEDGTIPDTEEGVGVGHTEKSSFEPEEDEQASE